MVSEWMSEFLYLVLLLVSLIRLLVVFQLYGLFLRCHFSQELVVVLWNQIHRVFEVHLSRVFQVFHLQLDDISEHQESLTFFVFLSLQHLPLEWVLLYVWGQLILLVRFHQSDFLHLFLEEIVSWWLNRWMSVKVMVHPLMVMYVGFLVSEVSLIHGMQEVVLYKQRQPTIQRIRHSCKIWSTIWEIQIPKR